MLIVCVQHCFQRSFFSDCKEDKYKDRDYKDRDYKDRDYKDRRQRSPLREPNLNPGTTDRKVAWVDEGLGTAGTSTGTTTTTGYKSATGSTLRGLSSLDTRTLGTTSASGKVSGGLDPNINFINDQEDGVLTKDGGVRGYLDLPGRWTRVDVPVPAAGSGNWGRRIDPLASTYPPKACTVGGSSRLGPEASARGMRDPTQEMAASGSSAASAPPNVNATYTVNGESSNSTSPNSSRFKPKKSLRDLETSSGNEIHNVFILYI